MKIVFFGLVIFQVLIFTCCNKNKIEKVADPEEFYDVFPDSQIIVLDNHYKQYVHPDIIFNKKSNRFILTCTPYPYCNNKVENPYIFYSSNTINFFGLNNPVVPTPKNGHNDDPDIFFDNSSNKYYLYYLETCLPDSQNIVILKSTDVQDWEKVGKIHFNIKSKDDFIVSPSVIDGINHKYLMFFVNTQTTCKIQYIESDSVNKWDYSKKINIKVPFPNNYYPWHIDIILYDNTYYILCSTIYNLKNSLFISRSKNLIDWETRELLSPKDISNFNCKFIYRSSGVFLGSRFIYYYSFCNYQGVWKIGRKSISISELFR